MFFNHGELVMHIATFSLTVPFPEDTAKAETRKGNELLWSRTVSKEPPKVSFETPNGGTYSSTETMEISWTASDSDGDDLQYGYAPCESLVEHSREGPAERYGVEEDEERPGSHDR